MVIAGTLQEIPESDWRAFLAEVFAPAGGPKPGIDAIVDGFIEEAKKVSAVKSLVRWT